MVRDAPFAAGDREVSSRERLALLEPQRPIGALRVLSVQGYGGGAQRARRPGLQGAGRRFRPGLAAHCAQPRPGPSGAGSIRPPTPAPLPPQRGEGGRAGGRGGGGGGAGGGGGGGGRLTALAPHPALASLGPPSPRKSGERVPRSRRCLSPL